MKYAFVSLSILAIWIAITVLIVELEYSGLLLPITALIMTIALFLIGFSGQK